MITSLLDQFGNRYGGEMVLDPSMTVTQDATGRNILTAPGGVSTFLRPETGAVTRNIADKQIERLSAKDFDAIGVGDETLELQAAVAGAVNSELWLKEGATYTVSGNLALPVGCRIMGNNATIINDITTPIQLFTIEYSRCAIRDLAIVNLHADSNVDGMTYGGQRSSPISIGTPGNLSWIEDTTLHNIEISGGIEETVGIVAGFGMVRGVQLIHCYVDGNFLTSFHIEWNNPTGPVPSGIVSPHAIKFSSCRATNNLATIGAAFRSAYYFAGAYQVSMEDCRAENVISGFYISNGDTGVQTGEDPTYRITRCAIMGYSSYGLAVQGSATADINSVVVEDSVIKSSDPTGVSLTHAARIFINAGGIVFQRNRISDAKFGIVASDSPHLTIQDNLFDSLYGNAISLVSAPDARISNNRFRNVSTGSAGSAADCAVKLYASPRALVSHNTFGYVGQTTLPYLWITAQADATLGNRSPNTRVLGNLFHTNASGIMCVNGDAAYGFLHPMFTSGNHVHERLDTLGQGVTAPFIEEVAGRRITWTAHAAAPTDGRWTTGDITYNSNYTAGDPDYRICIGSGDPGTWLASNASIPVIRETVDGFYATDVAANQTSVLLRGTGTEWMAAASGWITRIMVRMVDATTGTLVPLTAGFIVFTVTINGAGTGLAGSIVTAGSTLSIVTSSRSIAFNAGDRVTIGLVTDAAFLPTGTSDVVCSLLIEYP